MNSNTEISFAFNRRYLTVLCLVYVIGTYLGLKLDFLTKISLRAFAIYTGVFAWIIIFLSLFLWLPLRKQREAATLILACGISVLIFIGAVSRCYFFFDSYNKTRFRLAEHPSIEGVVKSEPLLNKSGNSYIVNLDVYTASNDTETVTFDKKCLTRIYIAEDKLPEGLSVGDSVRVIINLPVSKVASFEGGFDFDRSLLQKGIAYVGFSNKAELITPFAPRHGFSAWLDRIGLSLRARILNSAEYYNYSNDEKQLLKGILVGETDDFSDELYYKYSTSGFIHIASVSGMHTSYLFLALAVLLGFFKLPKRGICLITIPVLILFASVAGFTPSVMRAVIMTGTFLLASVFRRQNDGITSLSMAGVSLLIYNPLTLESVGALLSFGATLGILIFCPPITKQAEKLVPYLRRSRPQKSGLTAFIDETPRYLARYCSNSFILSFSATIGIAYFMAYFFGKLQWGSIFGNILVSPLVAMAFIFGYVNSAIGAVSKFLGFLIGKLFINPPLYLINAITAFFANDFFVFSVPSPPDSFFVIYVIICTAFRLLLYF